MLLASKFYTNMVSMYYLIPIMKKKITYFLFCNRRQIGNAGLGLWCHFQQCLSYIMWLSVLLVEETGGPGEIHRPESTH
jgi:hypothetical protein